MYGNTFKKRVQRKCEPNTIKVFKWMCVEYGAPPASGPLPKQEPDDIILLRGKNPSYTSADETYYLNTQLELAHDQGVYTNKPSGPAVDALLETLGFRRQNDRVEGRMTRHTCIDLGKLRRAIEIETKDPEWWRPVGECAAKSAATKSEED